jgi:uncharacterized protein YbjT (DUF2867 family)
MPVYAVTGASGHLGRFAIEQLLARGVPPSEVVAVVRDRGKAASVAGRGVTVREAHYSRPETLGAALGNRTYELGGQSFGLPDLARAITEVTGATVAYRDLPGGEYASWLQRASLDEATARFVATLDASIARGDLETSSQDLPQLLGAPPRPSPRSYAPHATPP